MKKTSLTLCLFALASITTGCATITKDANQPVQIETYSKDNQPVAGVKCTAKNDRGEWSTTTPGIVNVHRSGNNLLVNCEKEGNDPGVGTLVSRANGGMFGNILFGGGIGAIIDHNKGTAYTYPSWVRVILGDSLVYDRKNEKENTVMQGEPATAENTTNTQSAAANTATTEKH